MNKYLEIYLDFLKIGSFTIGGGYVMVPIMEELAVKQKKWCTEDEVLEYITIAQSLPGMFGANVATNVGYKVGGGLGSFAAVSGMVTPSLVIITLFASVYDTLMQYQFAQNAFRGIQCAVLALILLTGVNLYKKSVKHRAQAILLIIVMGLTVFLDFNPFYLILSGLGIGVIVALTNKKAEDTPKNNSDREV